MGRRAASPTPSENEVDILGALVDESDSGEGASAPDAKQNDFDLDFGDLMKTGGGGGSDEEDDDEAFIASRQRSSNRKATNLQGKSVKKGGGFQAMGLDKKLLQAITRKGFSVPTPIQRKTIPLVLDGKDVVGMARTGSGKTAAFVIPMVERLKAHSAQVGARALIMSPSRELAEQTMRVVKEFSRGTDLKCIMLIGGDSLEEQFALMASNPDIIIATPGRFLHLKVEMSLSLSSIRYAVFDEADRLFEQGFGPQLTEILHALPLSRQTLLFSATLPSSLVEFARAGLQDPSLVRLDAETKISPDLEAAFFSVRKGEKEGALLHILHDVIKMPLGLPEGVEAEPAEQEQSSKKRKRSTDKVRRREKPTEHSTIIFAATKFRVEYLVVLLRHAGFAVSYVYGSLDQTARKMQVEDFRKGRSNILVVTDVAARGIDIPILANVINYDFPPQPKMFVHRVGRTARAGQRGWAYCLVRVGDAPYLLDLQLFLGKKLVVGRSSENSSFSQDVVVGALKRDDVSTNIEWVEKALGDNDELSGLSTVAEKAEKQYMGTRNAASTQSVKRAREIVQSKGWTQLHQLFGEAAADAEEARAAMLAKISGFKPQETIFEIGPKGKSNQSEAAEIARSLRSKVGPRKSKAAEEGAALADLRDAPLARRGDDPFGSSDDEVNEEEDEDEEIDDDDGQSREGTGSDDEDELEITISDPKAARKASSSWQDPEIFMSYIPRHTSAAEEKAYGVTSGSATNFVQEARDAAMDLTNDEGAKSFGEPTRSRMRWDKKQSKYVSTANDEDGSRGAKARMIRGESGVKIAASFQSGRFDRWRQAQRIGKLPRVGDAEDRRLARNLGVGEGQRGTRFRHKGEKAPKEADKYRDNYHVQKKRVAEAKEKRIGKFRDGEGSREVKGVDDIRKARELKEKKRQKNARPAKRAKR
ncbi:DEAD-domain-containing protein [Thozetella sp. PMI_491]|nr:DEAD-domain-containing protein [Thozetella sp. PMI_491]